jgi:4-amino-4-deoxy-L-arabinose transferase-like glycosyltransferase
VAGAERQARGWFVLLALVGIVTAARLAYLAWFCPYTLVEDEAHYWEWSRRLGWSYYSKGPGVAWAIAASAAVCSRLGVELNEVVVRAPAVLSGGVLMLAVGGLARDVTGTARAGIVAAAMVLLVPLLWFTALLMTIDMPYYACWGLAAWAGHRALRRGSGAAWLGLGAAVGAGFLFKYTMVLLAPGLVLFAIANRRNLQLAPRCRWWMAGGAALGLLALAPVVIYNAQHDWVTVRHLMGHLGMTGGDVPRPDRAWVYTPRWMVDLLVSQVAVLGPLGAVMIAGAIWAWRERAASGAADRAYLLWCGVPVLVFYLAVSLRTDVNANWPVAGYITLFPLAAWALERARLQRDQIARAVMWAWRGAIVIGVLAALVSLRLDVIAESSAARGLGRLGERLGYVKPGRPLIPMGRLMGAEVMAADVDRLVNEIEAATGQKAFVVGHHYGRASLLAFYMAGRPTVYCTNARTGDGRRSQYDLWRDTDLDDLELLGGRPAVLVGGRMELWTPAFARVTEYGPLNGETKTDRMTYIGHEFLGLPAPGGGQR